MRFAAVLLIVVVLLGGAFFWVTRAASPERLAQDFEAAWEAPGTSALARYFRYGMDDPLGRAFARELARRAWLDARPQLEARGVEVANGQARAHFVTAEDGRALRVVFDAVLGTWYLRGADLPPLRPAPIADAIRVFEERWREGSFERVLELLDEDYRAERGAALRRDAEKRAWLESRPALGRVELEDTGPHVLASWPLEGDALRARFEWWKPAWRIHFLRFPPR